jgi:hypothetical protein
MISVAVPPDHDRWPCQWGRGAAWPRQLRTGKDSDLNLNAWHRRALENLKGPPDSEHVHYRDSARASLPGSVPQALRLPRLSGSTDSEFPLLRLSAVSQALFPARPAVPRSLLLTASVSVFDFHWHVLFLSQALSVSGLSVCLSL